MRNALLALFLSLSCCLSTSQRALPETIDSSAVHLSVIHTNGATMSGSGFYLGDSNYVYLVTARHVLLNPTLKTNLATVVIASSYNKYDDTNKIVRSLFLPTLFTNQNIRLGTNHDVAVIRIARFNESRTEYRFLDGVQHVANGEAWILPMDIALRYKDVLLGNEAFILGYPLAIGRHELDPDRPLLRKGSISGKNPKQGTLILDAAVFKGNSGGPAFQYNHEFAKRSVKLIGLVSRFVRIVDEKRSSLYNDVTEVDITNSGYSVIEPIDHVLELLWEK